MYADLKYLSSNFDEVSPCSKTVVLYLIAISR